MATAVLATLATSCSPRAQIGTDLLWVSTFESGTFNEWTDEPGGAATADPLPNAVEVSDERAHRGRFAAKLTIATTTADVQQNAGLLRVGGLPVEAYYSAWYYLPSAVTVGTFWTIFKLRRRVAPADSATSEELYDGNIRSRPSGDMTFWIFDHRVGGQIPLQMPDVIVPVGTWFQVEVHYRNAQDDTGRATFWLNGALIVDVDGIPMGPTPWVEWDLVNVGTNLSPTPVTLFIDDAAISVTRVGPDGVLGN